MEAFVRGGSREAILDANMKVDSCVCAGAMAMGAAVDREMAQKPAHCTAGMVIAL
jgi:hypothetical protein